MEGISLIPSFARGLNILLVDHDTISLLYLASLLEQYSFQVTTTEVASLALSMICEQEDRFKLVIANMNMPDMDRLSFPHILLKKDIPFILMSSERDVNKARRALAEGACYFLEKPIFLEDLKHVWQHVYRRRGNPTKKSLKAISNEGKVVNISKESQGSKTKEAGGVFHGNDCRQHMTTDPKGKNKQQEVLEVGLVGKNHVRESENTCIEWLRTSSESQKQGRIVMKRANDHGGESKQQEKRSKLSSELTPQMDFVSSMRRAIEEERPVERKDNNKSSTDKKKSRFLWSPKLHLKFTAALSALGDKNARPKKILKMMNVSNLTLRQVASHLQKYKAQVQRINETGVTSLPPISKSSGPYGRTEIAESHKKQNFLPSRLGYESSNFGYKSLRANPNSYLSTDTNRFPYDLNKNENREAFGLEGGSVQVPELELPNLKTETRNRFSLDSTGTTPGDATNLEEFLADFNNESQQLEAITEQAPPNQPLIEYGDLLKVLEEDPEDLELYAFGSELNPSDVDRYCEWLREILGGNVTNSEQFEL